MGQRSRSELAGILGLARPVLEVINGAGRGAVINGAVVSHPSLHN